MSPPPSLDKGDIVERLRSSAKAFRDNPIYDSEGDGCFLTVQADELEEAADLIEALSVSCIDGREKQAGDPSGNHATHEPSPSGLGPSGGYQAQEDAR